MRSFVKHILNILLLVSMAACLEYTRISAQRRNVAIDPAGLEHSCAEQHNGFLGSIGVLFCPTAVLPLLRGAFAGTTARNPP